VEWPIARTYAAPVLELRGRRLAWGERTWVMGIINVTPDSFSGDGLGGDVAAAVALARAFEAAGADIIDVGGESSRPGAEPVTAAQEAARVEPAVAAIRRATTLPIAIDTYHASVAAAALAAGADMVNDITGFRHDAAMARLVADRGAAAVVMHNQRGRTTKDVIGDIAAGQHASLCLADEAGIPRGRIVLDPGFGFGWTPEENLEMLRRLPELWAFELPLLVGTSRKSTLGTVTGLPVDQRLEASLASAAIAVAGGADIVRVHDVTETVHAVRVADAIVRGTWQAPA
jgi:dihydropteroate synthase